jgi:hypothetical protein
MTVSAGNRLLNFSFFELLGPITLFVLVSRVSDVYAPADWLVSPAQALVAILLGMVLWRRLRGLAPSFRFDRVLVLLAVYSATMLLSAATAANRIQALAGASAFLRDVLIVWLILQFGTSPRELRLCLWAMALGAATPATAAIAHAGLGLDAGGLSTLSPLPIHNQILIWTVPPIRLDGPVGVDSNVFAQILVTIFPVTLYLAWSERSIITTWLGLASGVLLGVVALWTHSRGGLVALVVTIAAIGIMQRRSKGRLATLAAVTFAITLLGPSHLWTRVSSTVPAVGRIQAAVTQQDAAPEKPTTASAGTDRPAPATPEVPATMQPALPVVPAPAPPLESAPAPPVEPAPAPPVEPAPPPVEPRPALNVSAVDRRNDSVFDRFSLFKVGIAVARDHLLTGIGKGNFLKVYGQYAPSVDPNLPKGDLGPHNTPVHILAETGILGLAAWLATLVTVVAGLREASRRGQATGSELADYADAIQCALIAYLVASMFLNDNIYARLLWLIVGLAAAIRQTAQASTVEAPGTNGGQVTTLKPATTFNAGPVP